MQILTPTHRSTIDEIKSTLLDFIQFLQKYDHDQKDILLLRDLLINLDDLFLLVVAGEYNSGKSAFINAFLGNEYLKTGITPTTSHIEILRYGESRIEKRLSPGQSEIELPAGILRDLTIVDTPGTNAILREHESLTTDFIPRSDLVMFITSVDRPFTESERAFLEQIRQWGKKIIFIINKIDIIENENEIDEVIRFVSSSAIKLLGFEPKIYTLSSKDALKQKLSTGLPDLSLKIIEDYILGILDPETQIKLKLLNPLKVIDTLVNKYQSIIKDRMELISSDVKLLDDIQQQLTLFEADMMKSIKFRYSDIDKALLEYEKRGVEYFEEVFRFGRIMDLLNKQRIQAEYNKVVVKDLSFNIDQKINEIIDWLVYEDLKQWQAITYKIDQRIMKFENRIIENLENRQIRFERQKIIEAISRETQKITERFDKDHKARKIADDAQMAVAASAAIEAGALGLGALVTILATTASADLTGILLAGLTATLGLLIIPAKKKQVKSLFSKNIDDIRKKLTTTITDEFQSQIKKITENVNVTISPYSRFIRSEQNELQVGLERIVMISRGVFQLEEKVNHL